MNIWTAAKGSVACVTIYFDDLEDLNWAISIWKSVRPREGKLDLNKPFEIVIEAELDGKGKLINPRFIEKKGDAILQDLFSRMVTALNDSGLLIFLQPISKDNPGATVKIDGQEYLIMKESDVMGIVEGRAASKRAAA